MIHTEAWEEIKDGEFLNYPSTLVFLTPLLSVIKVSYNQNIVTIRGYRDSMALYNNKATTLSSITRDIP